MTQIVVRSDEKSIVILDQQRERVFVADPEGRVSLVHTPEASYKRSRYNRWFRVMREPWPGLESVDPECIHKLAQEWAASWEAAQFFTDEATRRYLLKWLTEFAEFHAEDARTFASLIPEIPILPPDAYQALYIRIQEGCPWNRCSFCSFYKGERYRVLSSSEVQKHAADMRHYWRKALRSRHGIFLGDANAIAIPPDQLSQRMKLLREQFPESELQQFHSFIDFFSGGYRTTEDLRELHDLGLVRISVGVESGNAELMQLVNKPLEEDALLHIAESAKQAGILINLIFLIGLGGEQFRDRHRRSSLDLIRRLRNGMRIYLSPLVIDVDQPYAEIAQKEGWSNLDDAALRLEMNAWQTALRSVPNIQVSPYHIRQFLY